MLGKMTNDEQEAEGVTPDTKKSFSLVLFGMQPDLSAAHI